MSTEKFYRNVWVRETEPVQLGYPQTLIEAEVGDQSRLFTKCDKGWIRCNLWLVAYENEPSRAAVLPGSWARGGTPLSHFELKVFVGQIKQDEYQKVLSLVKNSSLREFRIRRIVKNPALAKTLSMYFMGLPLKLEIRPAFSTAEEKNGWLKVTVMGNLESIEVVR